MSFFLVARLLPPDSGCLSVWDASTYEPKRYWRGPVWAVMNHMIVAGLVDAGESELASRISSDTRNLVEAHGMAWYGAGRFFVDSCHLS